MKDKKLNYAHSVLLENSILLMAAALDVPGPILNEVLTLRSEQVRMSNFPRLLPV